MCVRYQAIDAVTRSGVAAGRQHDRLCNQQGRGNTFSHGVVNPCCTDWLKLLAIHCLCKFFEPGITALKLSTRIPIACQYPRANINQHNTNKPESDYGKLLAMTTEIRLRENKGFEQP